MTYSINKQRTLRQRQLTHRYRQLILFLCGIISLLIVLLAVSKPTTAQADEIILETYRSVSIHTGDCLWDLAETYKLPEMETEEYISEIKRINHLTGSELVAGEYLILPIYIIDPAVANSDTILYN